MLECGLRHIAVVLAYARHKGCGSIGTVERGTQSDRATNVPDWSMASTLSLSLMVRIALLLEKMARTILRMTVVVKMEQCSSQHWKVSPPQ